MTEAQLAELADLKERVKRLEMLASEEKKALQLEIRGGFQLITGRLDGIETDLSMSIQPKLERIEDRLERVEAFLRERLNGADRR
jgi:hypothetical protein